MDYRYIISLGSNLSHAGGEEITLAVDHLSSLGRIISRTPTYVTPDAYHPEAAPYTNAIVVVCSAFPADTLNLLLKEYESSRGRESGSKVIPIDMDIVCRDNEVLRPRDYNAPYFVGGLYLLTKVSDA